MSPPTASEFDAADLIEKIAKGQVPRDFMLFAARGFLPVPQEDLVAVIAYLAGHADAEVAEAAKASVNELPSKVVLAFAHSDSAGAEQLHNIANASADPQVVEAVVRNRNARDETIAAIARRATPMLQDVIVINQERILRSPAILDSLLENPALTMDIRRRALEVREEFFEKRARLDAAAAADAAARAAELPEGLAPWLEQGEELTPEQEADLQRLLAQTQGQETSEIQPPAEAELADKDESIWNKILKMTVAQKVQLAYKGGKTARGILIRDRNKMVCTAVVKSPRITESEIESIAGMRNVEEEVLRLIGSNREYTGKYPIIITLVRNPKAPIGVVLPLINHLTLRDLKSLQTDKNVTEVVRVTARKLFQQRSKKD